MSNLRAWMFVLGLATYISVVTPTPVAPAAPVASAPWWAVPLVAGAFLIIGALIAFVSTAASDRRKLAREDRRQWDKEVRDAYVEITKHVSVIMEFRYQVIPDEARRARYEAGRAALDAIGDQGSLLAIIGTRKLVERLYNLERAGSHIVSVWHDRLDPPKDAWRAFRAAHGELPNTVKSELRVEPYKPFVRPPMTRAARLGLAVRVRLASLKRTSRSR